MIAFFALVSPVIQGIGTVADVMADSDKVARHVDQWRLDGCPERWLDGLVHYTCEKDAPPPSKKPVVKKKHVAPKVAPMPPAPPVYVPPPLPQVPAEQPAPPPPAKHELTTADGVQWGLDHLLSIFLTVVAFGVIGHGLRRIYRIWKGIE